MYHNIPNLLVGDLEAGELIKCLNVCLSEGLRGWEWGRKDCGWDRNAIREWQHNTNY